MGPIKHEYDSVLSLYNVSIQLIAPASGAFHWHKEPYYYLSLAARLPHLDPSEAISVGLLHLPEPELPEPELPEPELPEPELPELPEPPELPELPEPPEPP